MRASWQYIGSRVWSPLVALAAAYLIAAGAYYRFEHAVEGGPETYADALWFCLVTMSTVGYGDIYPQTRAGRFVGVAVILFSLGALGFLFSRIGEIVVEGKHRERLGLNGTDFKEHVVILGWSPVARVALGELLASGARVAVVCESEELLFNLRQLAGKRQLFLLRGQPRNPPTLDLVNIDQASTVLCCDEDDTVNLVLALNVRRANPRVELIAAIHNDELRLSFAGAGVDFVTNPFEISGRLIASAAFEPEVAHFLEDITSHQDDGHDLIQQVIPESLVGWTCGRLQQTLAEHDGPLLVAHVRRSKPDGFYRPNPPRDSELRAGDVVIVLANAAQTRALGKLIGSL